MDPKNIGAGIFILILAFLFINNSTGTSTVLSALGSQSTNLITTLQGRSTSGIQVSSGGITIPPITLA